MENIKDFNSFTNENPINEGWNLHTLQARVEHMNDLYVKIKDRGDEVFKVVSVDDQDIHTGSLEVVSEETGEELTIDHDDIKSTLVADQYEGYNESIIIEKDLKELEALKKDISSRLQRYIYLIESSHDLDDMDQEIVLEKLESLRSDINNRLDDLKQNIWLEK